MGVSVACGYTMVAKTKKTKTKDKKMEKQRTCVLGKKLFKLLPHGFYGMTFMTNLFFFLFRALLTRHRVNLFVELFLDPFLGILSGKKKGR